MKVKSKNGGGTLTFHEFTQNLTIGFGSPEWVGANIYLNKFTPEEMIEFLQKMIEFYERLKEK